MLHSVGTVAAVAVAAVAVAAVVAVVAVVVEVAVFSAAAQTTLSEAAAGALCTHL